MMAAMMTMTMMITMMLMMMMMVMMSLWCRQHSVFAESRAPLFLGSFLRLEPEGGVWRSLGHRE